MEQFKEVEPVTESTLSELLSICQQCNGHSSNADSYTSPGFSDFLNRALTISDIPMQSYSIERSSRDDPDSAAWEDSIKNIILDLTSFNTKIKYDTCILLVEDGYKYSDSTIDLLNIKHCTTTSSMVLVEADNATSEYFNITVKRNRIVEYTCSIERKELVSILISWYIPNSTIILCHDNTVPEYIDSVSMMPQSTWSVSCTPTNYIEILGKDKKCKYICSTYSCLGSLETRAVGSGLMKISSHKVPGEYEGKLNYYSRCVRGSKHSSGKCYDCYTLYRVITSICKSPNCSPIKTTRINFSDSFIQSAAIKATSTV